MVVMSMRVAMTVCVGMPMPVIMDMMIMPVDMGRVCMWLIVGHDL
jgi:hypothetical protein